MPLRVLIVDDSGFFRHRIKNVLSNDRRLEIVGEGADGREAIALAKELRPDLITMDVEMPKLNGIEAVRCIMKECPTNILMLSSLTHEGAQVTLQALEAGAADYLTKDVKAWSDPHSLDAQKLIDQLVLLGRSSRYSSRKSTFNPAHTSYHPESSSVVTSSRSSTGHFAATTKKTSGVAARQLRETASEPAALRSKGQSACDENRTSFEHHSPRTAVKPHHRVKYPANGQIVLIGSSTGGPAALQTILMQLPKNFPYPIMLIQHMPKTFTGVFAERLNQQCQISVKEAEDGDELRPGLALLAPGGHQMIIESRYPDRVKVIAGDERLTYRPSVDITFASGAKVFDSRVLAIILTGMGADGADGARLLKAAGACVWAQNEESCTIYGMPQAVVKAGLADEILHLNEIGPLLAKWH